MNAQRKQSETAKPKSPPTADERNREAAERTVKRGARGNVQISQGKIVTPEDNDLNKLDKI